MSRVRKKIQHIDVLIFHQVVIYNFIMLIAVVAALLFFSFWFTITKWGNARVDLLQQISDNNATNRNSMISIMDYAYEGIKGVLVDKTQPPQAQDEKMQSTLKQIRHQIDAFGFEYKLDVVLNDKTSYLAQGQSEAELERMLHSYWYIKHFSGESDTSWSLRYQDITNVESYSLCYARTIYNKQKEVLGVVMLNASSAEMFRTYQRLVNTNSTIYILDEHGTVISHSNPSMIGLWLYTSDSFFSQYRADSSAVKKKGNQLVLVSNYYDPQSKWIFVEEQPISDFFYSYVKTLFWILPIIILVFLVMIMQSYLSARRITRPLLECTRHMGAIRDGKITLMPVQQQYKEIEVLSEGYNAMLLRIRTLIGNIKIEEEQKRQIEFAFLQAQINPHFLRNTLLGVKTLVITGKRERAAEMMTAFIEMLNVPLETELKGHSLREEIEYVKHYLTLMQCRYDTEFDCEIHVEGALEEMIIPSLILQPLVENAIFHGLSGEEGQIGKISIRAYREEKSVYLVVEDNGAGMTKEVQQTIWTEERHNSINSIGLKNVLSRLKYLFGEETRIEIHSEIEKGTKVSIVIVAKEESNENISSG